MRRAAIDKGKRKVPADRADGSGPNFLAVDFFCGAGGTTRGLIDAGGYVIAGIDKDDRCAKTFTENNLNLFLDHAPAQFLELDVFPKTRDYPLGQQDELFKILDGQLRSFRKKARGTPL